MRRNLPSSLPTGTVNSRSRPSSSPSGKPELRGTGQRRRWNLEFDGPHSSTVVRTTSAALHAPLADASPNARASVADFDPCPHVGSMAEPSSAAPTPTGRPPASPPKHSGSAPKWRGNSGRLTNLSTSYYLCQLRHSRHTSGIED
jgi:hypothetical protein